MIISNTAAQNTCGADTNMAETMCRNFFIDDTILSALNTLKTRNVMAAPVSGINAIVISKKSKMFHPLRKNLQPLAMILNVISTVKMTTHADRINSNNSPNLAYMASLVINPSTIEFIRIISTIVFLKILLLVTRTQKSCIFVNIFMGEF